MSEPLVSIIIPAYNYAHFITETLENVLEQTYINWECIVVDDGSTDNTTTIVDDFLRKHNDPRFKYIKVANSGTSAAKNIGIAEAAGQYIQFLDADDLLSADKLSVQTKRITHSGAGLVFSASRFFIESAGVKIEQRKYPKDFLAEEKLADYRLLSRLITNNIMTISSPLVKSDVVRAAGGFENTLHNNEDWLFWFKIAMLQPIFEFDDHVGSYVNIRIHSNSAMNQQTQMFLGEVRVREEIDLLLNKLSNNTEKEKLRKLNYDLLALHRVRSLKISEGLSYIMSNFIAHPIENFSLLSRACLKLVVRTYKTVVK
jgi:glycosyltransferase involved in cell wall biosynthesis